ncbi:MAG0920 family protein [Mycoplasma phocoeninasale]|uniref:MAG0920 family protein n=1 Tax=Mycoplasma phocoeninasale TaxID=2726117 RepID=UPI0019682E21|nr:hypothetical protein [Mycoplasma phocoeninasale]MBN0971001.1 hypothetical protein [Mycoplasma phocoeninasale]
MDLDSTSEIKSYIFLIVAMLMIIIPSSLFKLGSDFFYHQQEQILLKKGVSDLFLNENIAINNNFFKTFNKKFKFIFILLLIPMLLSFLAFLLLIIDLLITKNSYNATFLKYIFAIGGIVLFIVYLSDLLRIMSVIKEFKMWEMKNKDLHDASLFENLVTERNDDILKIFLQSYFEMSITITILNNKISLKFKNWREWILKSGRNFDDEFYYFLIFNYKKVSINGKLFSIEDYAYIYQNRNKLFNIDQPQEQSK